MNSNLPPLPKLIQVTDHDIVVDGQSIATWCGHNVQVIPGAHGAPPRVIVELIAERVVTDLHEGVDVVPHVTVHVAPDMTPDDVAAAAKRAHEQAQATR